MKKYEPPKILNISDTFHGKWAALALAITRYKEENKKVYIPIFESIIKRIKISQTGGKDVTDLGNNTTNGTIS